MALVSIFHRGNPRQGSRRAAVHALYGRLVEQARQPTFFLDWGVPDTLDGRFEVLALHAFLVLNRLKADHAATAGFAQDLFDTMFADMDRGLRELGASDLGVGRHVKAMARGLYGRIVAYERGLTGGDSLLEEALLRNFYGGRTASDAELAAVAGYVRRQAAALAAQPAGALLAGEVSFAAPGGDP